MYCRQCMYCTDTNTMLLPNSGRSLRDVIVSDASMATITEHDA